MAKRIVQSEIQGKAPLFLFLLGTLVFSLSTLPSSKGQNFMVTSLSSEFASDCQAMVNSIDAGANDGTCGINPVSTRPELKDVKGSVEVKLDQRTHRDPRDVNKIVSEDMWKYTLNIYGSGDPIKIEGFAKKEDYKLITSKVMADFNSGAGKMAARIRQAKIDEKKEAEKQARIDRCEINEDGKKMEGREKMNCRADRLSQIDDEEKAADYYQKNILPEIEAMLGSNDVRRQREGMALLKQLNQADVGGEFVKQSVLDLAKFGQFKYKSDQEKLAILQMNPNDPNRQAAIQSMRNSQLMADAYFRSRGITIGSQDWPMGNSGFDFATTLSSNLNDFQSRIDQNYAAILSQRQFLLQNPMQPQVQNPNQPQTPQQTGFQPAGTSPVNAWPASAQQQQQQRMVTPSQPRVSNPGGVGVPLVPLRSVSRR